MTDAACYSREDLRRYLVGELSEIDSDAIAGHVEDCPDCESTISMLDRESDTLIEAIRRPPENDSEPSAYRMAARRAKAAWSKTTATPPSSDESETMRLRDYEVLSPLARGGMGTVYRARHIRLNRTVALKVLPGRWLKDPTLVARFEREMRAVGSLKHPAIVQATDGGEENGTHFLVMELIEGVDCNSLVSLMGPLRVGDACEITRQAAEGMAYVHSQGIVHRDLKPSNLMMTSSGDVKVLDLGLARLADESMSSDLLGNDQLTTVGQLMGTLEFMSPEQMQDSHDVDERSDLYSLGATLYKLLCGQPVHRIPAGEPFVAKLRRIADGPIEPLANRDCEIPQGLCRLVDQLMDRDPAKRLNSMGELCSALEPFCGGNRLKPLAKEAIAKKRKQEQKVESAELTSTGTLTMSRNVAQVAPVRNRRFLWVAVALLSLATIALGAVITIETTSGTLVIETSEPDVEVRILKAGKPYRELSLSRQPNSLRLGAGQYEIDIISDADQLIVQEKEFYLQRGETRLAKIVRRTAPTPESSAATSGDPLATGPTFEGKTTQQWLELLRTERSASQVDAACQALSKLDSGDDREIVNAILIAARYQGNRDYARRGERASVRVWDSLNRVLNQKDQRIVFDEMTRSLANRSQTNLEFVLNYLIDLENPNTPPMGGELLRRLSEVVDDSDGETAASATSAVVANASNEQMRPVLVKALKHSQPQPRLVAAATLIDQQQHAADVVDALIKIVANSEFNLEERTIAAWHLGGVGKQAAAATDTLLATVRDNDPQVSTYAGYRVDSTTVSLKDAAIRSLAEIGDPSVAPALLEEWKRRIQGVHQNVRSPVISIRSRGPASSFTDEWVADAIERLLGRRPHAEGSVRPEVRALWRIDRYSVADVYRSAMRRDYRPTDRAEELAKQLLPFASDAELDDAYKFVRLVSKPPTPQELERELRLIEMLAERGDTKQVLRSLFVRRSEVLDTAIKERVSAASTIEAYRELAKRLLTEQPEVQDDYQAFLLQLLNQHYPGAAISFLDLVETFKPEDQLRGIIKVFDMVSGLGPGSLTDGSDDLQQWLAKPDNRAAIDSELRTGRSQAWLSLVVGMLLSNPKDAETMEIVKERFTEDSIKREELLQELIGKQKNAPDLDRPIIELLKLPALDELTTRQINVKGGRSTRMSIRAAYINEYLHRIVDEQRPRFIPYLKELSESEILSENVAAEYMLDKWK